MSLNRITLPDDSNYYQRSLIVGKTEILDLDISYWLDNEPISSFTASTIGGLSINSTGFTGGVLSVAADGVDQGETTITFNYSTATRQDCFKARVLVKGDC